jgi:hypothetical protein
MRGEGVGAQNKRKTHCKEGHPFDRENTGFHRSGARQCLQCTRRRERLRSRIRRMKKHGNNSSAPS